MLKKFFVVLLASLSLFAGSAVTAAPASAHISTCVVAAYNPSKIPSSRVLRASGRWYCPTVAHHEYVASHVSIQYWSERIFWSDGWATLGRNKVQTARTEGTNFAGAPCANGAKRYRTKHTLYMVGAHGVVEKNAYSYGTTINC